MERAYLRLHLLVRDSRRRTIAEASFSFSFVVPGLEQPVRYSKSLLFDLFLFGQIREIFTGGYGEPPWAGDDLEGGAFEIEA